MNSVLLQGLLACFGLTIAYLVWTDDTTPRETTSGITIAVCTPDRIGEINFESDRVSIKIERRDDDDDSFWWVTSTRTPESGDPTVTAFVGGQRVDDYLERIAPFVAKRSLGEQDAEQLATFELDEEQASSLSFDCGDRAHAFRIGASVHGSSDRYIQKQEGGDVYLVEARMIGDLQSSSLMMQRPMHRFETTEIQTIEIAAFGANRTILQHDRLNARGAQWVDAAEPDRRNQLFGSWITAVNQLNAVEYLEPNAEPGSDLESDGGLSVIPLVRLEYKTEDGDALGFLELVRVEGADEPAFYTRSEATRSWVTIRSSAGQQVEQDVRTIVGLEEPVAEVPTTDEEAPEEEQEEPAPEAEGLDEEDEPASEEATEAEEEAPAEAVERESHDHQH
jgi:hypothetical protein